MSNNRDCRGDIMRRGGLKMVNNSCLFEYNVSRLKLAVETEHALDKTQYT